MGRDRKVALGIAGLVGLALAGCAPRRTTLLLPDVLVDDRPDDRDVNVGALFVGPPGLGEFACTGTLVARDLVLTAAHCVPEGGMLCFVLATYPEEAPAKEWRLVASAVVPTLYRSPSDGNCGPDGRRCRADVAILRLAEPVPSIAPAPVQLRAGPHLRSGTPVRMVGFRRAPPLAPSPGRLFRYTGRTWADRVLHDRFVFRASADRAHFCRGESGGPDFVRFRGGERIVAIHTASTTYALQSGCAEGRGAHAVSTRVDHYLSFLALALGLRPPIPVASRERQ